MQIAGISPHFCISLGAHSAQLDNWESVRLIDAKLTRKTELKKPARIADPTSIHHYFEKLFPD